MMTTQAVIGTVCVDVVNVLLVNYFFSSFYRTEYKNRKSLLGCIALVYVFIHIVFFFRISSILLDFLIIILISNMYDFDFNRKVKDIMLILLTDWIIEMVIYGLYRIVFNMNVMINGELSNGILTIFQIVISKYLLYVFMSLMIYKQSIISDISSKIFKYISFGASLFYAFAIIASFNEVLFYHEEVGRIFVFTLVLYNVVLVIFNFYQNMHIRTVNELETMKQNRSYQGQYWKDYYKSYAEIRKIKHDLLNSYTGLYGLVKDGKFDDVKLHLESSIRNLKDMERVHYFGNPLIDAIISKKVSDAREKGIDIKFHLGIINIGDIDEEDLGILLANALDNAIEANEKSKVKGIEVRVTTVNHFLKINVMNYVDDIRKVSFHKTTKTLDKENHGIGIRSMMDCVRKYSGSLIYDKRDNMVILSIVMSIR